MNWSVSTKLFINQKGITSLLGPQHRCGSISNKILLRKISQSIEHTNLYVNSLVPGRFGCDFKSAIFNLVLRIVILRSSTAMRNDDECHETQLVISQQLGNGLVTSGNKPWPESMLTLFNVAIWRLWATINEDCDAYQILKRSENYQKNIEIHTVDTIVLNNLTRTMAIGSYFRFDDDNKIKYIYFHNPQKTNG